MSSKSKSVSPVRQKPVRRQERKDSREDPDSHKVFLTNLNGQIDQKQIQQEVKKLFEKYGEVIKLSLKKHKNGFYYFGFLQFPPGFEAYQSVKALDQYSLFGKNMKVRQDRQSQGCFHCKRMGHFARQCPENRDRDRNRRRSYSNQRRSRDRYDDRRDRRDKYERRDRQRERDYRDRDRDRQRDRYGRSDRGDRYDRNKEDDRDRKHERKRNRSRSESDSRSSSGSSYKRQERKERKDKRRRSRSRS